jgi:catechol 2,3-dioxygenase-like lactoylglutathione lyase family enzyme
MAPICIDHLTLPVGDLERSVSFYRGALVRGLGWQEWVSDVERLPTFGLPGTEGVACATAQAR